MNSNIRCLIKLKNKLDILQSGCFTITEHFTNINTYNLNSLNLDIEDGEIIFYDNDDILLSSYHVLNALLYTSLKENGVYLFDHYAILNFNCGGYIKIEYPL